MNRIITILSFFIITQYNFAQNNICFIDATNSDFQYYIDSCNNELIIDVRLANEFKINTILMAINAPTKNILVNLIDTLDRDTPIMVYCIEGDRSVQACEVICKKGFTFVVNLKYGLKEW